MPLGQVLKLLYETYKSWALKGASRACRRASTASQPQLYATNAAAVRGNGEYVNGVNQTESLSKENVLKSLLAGLCYERSKGLANTQVGCPVFVVACVCGSCQ